MKRIDAYAPLRCLWPILLIAASGCGLSDYERRMDGQRKRVLEFDEANAALDDPINKPPDVQLPGTKGAKEVVPAWPFEVYLRLPKGYGVSPKDASPYNDPFPCFRYAGTDPNVSIFVAAALVMDPKGKEEFGKYFPDNFRVHVRVALEDYYGKAYKTTIRFKEKAKPQKVEVKAVTAYPDPVTPKKIAFEYYQYTDEAIKNVKEHRAFDVYIHESGGRQACVVVQRPLSIRDALPKAIETCLGTLDISPAAAARAKYFKSVKGQ